ncbi:MAG: hypothetical protein ACJAZT_000155 [Gammaproteobacteria bacterium]|jgi:hypothetical protein
MKKIIISTLVLFAALNAGTALAGSCPMDMKQIDSAIGNSYISSTDMDKVKALRTEGEKLHKSGNHSASVAALGEAKDLLGI